MRVKGIEGE
jgi:large subunit ribosomal protein LP0